MSDSDFVRGLAAIGLRDRPLAGGKGASLGELTGAGFRVPPGYVVTTLAFERALQALHPGGAAGEIRRDVERLSSDDHAGITRVTAAIRERIEAAPLPAGLRGAIEDHYRRLCAPAGDRPVAVRSSTTSEDGADASFAGLQDTYLWVRGPAAVADHIRRCWASLYSVESVTYRRRLGLPEEPLAMGVVVQRMVDPRCSGVMFTRSPTTGDRSVVCVEASWGVGSAIVSGDVTPDIYVVSKVTGEIIKRAVAAKLHQHRMAADGSGIRTQEVPAHLQTRACLGDDEVHALARIARRIEEHYGTPQDIEWAISADSDDLPRVPAEERIFLLQSRPETVWANRDAAPVAVPRRKAFDHVLDALGKGFSS